MRSAKQRSRFCSIMRSRKSITSSWTEVASRKLKCYRRTLRERYTIKLAKVKSHTPSFIIHEISWQILGDASQRSKNETTGKLVMLTSRALVTMGVLTCSIYVSCFHTTSPAPFLAFQPIIGKPSVQCSKSSDDWGRLVQLQTLRELTHLENACDVLLNVVEVKLRLLAPADYNLNVAVCYDIRNSLVEEKVCIH